MAPPTKIPRIEGDGLEEVDNCQKDKAEQPDELSCNYGIIRFVVKDVSTLVHIVREWSPAIYIQGVAWRAAATKEVHERPDEGEQLYIYVSCKENKSRRWSIDSRVNTILVHPDNSKTIDHLEPLEVTFKHDCTDQGSYVVKWTDLMKEGFITDDTITIETRISITKTTGIRTDVPIDFDNDTELYHGLILDLDGAKINVSREFLSIHSPVFKTMFYGPFDERKKKTIKLKDVDPKEFKEMLRVLYPSRYTVNEDNVDVILKLADRFQIKSLLDSAEDFLINSTTLKSEKKLLLSDTYRLAHLEGDCLDKFDSLKKLIKLKKTPEYTELSDQTKSALLDKMIELAEEDDEE